LSCGFCLFGSCCSCCHGHSLFSSLLWKLINGLFIYYAEPHFPPFSIKLFAPRVIKFLYPKRDFFDPQSHQHHTPKEDINARKRKGEKSPGKIIK
jgi:hypothetical protein